MLLTVAIGALIGAPLGYMVRVAIERANERRTDRPVPYRPVKHIDARLAEYDRERRQRVQRARANMREELRRIVPESGIGIG